MATAVGQEMANPVREHTRERVSRRYAEQLALLGVVIATGADSRLPKVLPLYRRAAK